MASTITQAERSETRPGFAARKASDGFAELVVGPDTTDPALGPDDETPRPDPAT